MQFGFVQDFALYCDYLARNKTIEVHFMILSHLPNKFLSILLSRVSDFGLARLERAIQSRTGRGWGGSTTREEAIAVSAFVERCRIKGIVALDIGANLGNWSAEFQSVRPSASIIAFEPSKFAFNLLLNRFEKNERVQCINIGLGKENCETYLYADVSGGGLGSLTKRRLEHFGINFEHAETIQLRTLDSWLSDEGKGIYPNILKMDVEGHELDVLKGATEALKYLQIIQFEFGGCNIDTRSFFQDFWYFFAENDFDLYRITPKGVKLVESYSENDEIFRTTNYIAVRSTG